MKRPSRMKFQVNKLGYYSLLGFVVANIVYTVTSLQIYPIGLFIGFDTAINIVLLLFGFLAAVKLKLYDKLWCYISFAFAIAQLGRILLIPNSVNADVALNLTITLIISAAFAILGAAITLYKIISLNKIYDGKITVKELVIKERARQIEEEKLEEQQKQDRINANTPQGAKLRAKLSAKQVKKEQKDAANKVKEEQKNEKHQAAKQQHDAKKLAKLNQKRKLNNLEPLESLPINEEDIIEEMDGALLKLVAIDKIYSNNVQAVFNFNLDIMPHDFVVLVGPSGCGKSTTLRMVAGLESVTSGKLLLDGKLINKKAPSDRDIAMIFQDYALYGHMTVYQNIGFSLQVRKEKANYIHDKVIDASEFVKLQPELNRLPKNLSGGQRQRVALGRSIVRNAKIFLMDEPLSNLDAKLRDETRKEIVKLHHNLNATIIYVTHDQIEAMTMATKIVVMNLGYIQQVGTPIEVYTRPNNLFVAGFIGLPNMNFIKGKIEKNYFVCENNKFKLDKEQLDLLEPYLGNELILGVRPDAFTLDDIHAQDNWSITSEISFLEYYGANTSLRFKVSDQDFNATIRNRQNLNVGDKVTLSIIKEKVHFFDVLSTLRINKDLNTIAGTLKKNRLYYDVDSYLEIPNEIILSNKLEDNQQYQLQFRKEALSLNQDSNFKLLISNIIPNNNVYATTLKVAHNHIEAVLKDIPEPQLNSLIGFDLDFNKVIITKGGSN